MTLFVMSFFYNLIGDDMIIYLDLVFLLNYFFDFILLIGVAIILKRKIKIYNFFMGSFIGSSSLLILFLDTSRLEIIIIKFVISVLMIIVSFGYRSFNYTIKNITYLYILSVFLGGFLYLINNSFDYHNGLVFYNTGMSLNIILIIVLVPLLLRFYIRMIKDLKVSYSNYYKIKIYFNDHIVHSVAYLDTGNKLVSPYSSKPILLYYNKNPVFDSLRYTLIPYNTVSNNGYIKGYKVDKIYIDGIGYRKKLLVGVIDNKINIDGCDSLMGLNILEGI